MHAYVRRILRWLIFGLQRPDDDFTQSVRKVAICVQFAASPVPMALDIFWLVSYFSAEPSERVWGPLIATFIGFLFFVPPCVLGFFLVRMNQKVATDSVMIYVLTSIALGYVLLPLAVPQYPLIWISFASTVLTIISQTSATALILFIILIAHGIMVTNHIIFLSSASVNQSRDLTYSANGFLFAVADAHYVSTAELIVQSVTSLLLMWTGPLAVYAQVVSYRQLDDDSRASLVMASKVVKHIERYNTEGVRQLLQSHQVMDPLDSIDGTGNISTELASSFEAIASNLDAYRGYLPNYMFHSEQRLSGDIAELSPLEGDLKMLDLDDGGGRPDSKLETLSSLAISEDDLTVCSVVSSRERRESAGSACSSGRFHAANPIAITSAKQQTTQEKLSTAPPPLSAAPSTHSKLVGDELGQCQLGCVSLDGTVRSRTRRLVGEVDSIFCGTVAYLVVDFLPTSVRAKLKVDTHSHHSELLQFVNSVYDIANSLKGSVHSLVGDTLYASWNATQPVAQPELKAALCLARIAKAAQTMKLPDVSGAVCSGNAIVSTFTTNSRQQALLIHLPWQGRLDGCLRLARQCRTVIVDEQTANASSHSISYRCVDMVMHHSATSETDTTPDLFVGFMCDSGYGATTAPTGISKEPIYQLLAETEHEEGEWMYQLQQKEVADGSDTFILVIDALNSGDKELARRHLLALLPPQTSAANSNNSTTVLSSQQLKAVSTAIIEDPVLRRIHKLLFQA